LRGGGRESPYPRASDRLGMIFGFCCCWAWAGADTPMSCVRAASVSAARWHHRVVFTVASPWPKVALQRCGSRAPSSPRTADLTETMAAHYWDVPVSSMILPARGTLILNGVPGGAL